MREGQAALGMWADIVGVSETEFNDWHGREHIPERVAIPGFLGGRRYRAITGRPSTFMVYEIESLAVATSPAYLARLNDPTEWTRRMTPHIHNFIRTAFRVTARHGRGQGGVVATLRFAPAAGRDQGLRRWLAEDALAAVAERPGIVGAQLWEADAGASMVDTAERALRAGPDRVAAWVVLVEGTDPDAVRAARRPVLSPPALRARGAARDIRSGLYRLQYSLAT